MKKLNKLFLGLASVAAVAAPLAAVVSCGSTNSNGTIKVAVNTQREAVANAKATTATLNAVLALDGSDHSEADKSFNQQAFEGIEEFVAANQGKATKSASVKPASSDGEAQFQTMYGSTDNIAETVIVAPGFAHIGPLTGYNLGQRGAIILDGDVAKANIASVLFNVHQAAFLAGVATGNFLNAKADVYGKDGHLKAGTFGGLNFDTVTGFMAGFQDGIKFFNAHKAEAQKEVEFIDLGGKNDYFSGGFAPGQGTVISQKLINAGADVILPVAGPQFQDTLAEIKKSGKTIGVIGVDSTAEAMVNDPNILFSITKNLKDATKMELAAIIGAAGADAHAGYGKLLIGDLANHLVGITDGSTSMAPQNADVKAAVDAANANAAALAEAKTFAPEFLY